MKQFLIILLAGTALSLPLASASADILSRNAATAAGIIPASSGTSGSNSSLNNRGTTGAGSASDFNSDTSGNITSGRTGTTGTTGGADSRLSGALDGTATGTINGTQGAPLNSASITDLQEILRDRGVYNGTVNGTMDAGTIAALREYQRINGLSPNGRLDPATVRNLGLANAYGEDMSGAMTGGVNSGVNGNINSGVTGTINSGVNAEAGTAGASGAIGIRAGVAADASTLDRQGVITLQQALAANGFYDRRVDGLWGSNTTAALRAYQRRNNLVVTGRLDAQTAQNLGITMQPAR